MVATLGEFLKGLLRILLLPRSVLFLMLDELLDTGECFSIMGEQEGLTTISLSCGFLNREGR